MSIELNTASEVESALHALAMILRDTGDLKLAEPFREYTFTFKAQLVQGGEKVMVADWNLWRS